MQGGADGQGGVDGQTVSLLTGADTQTGADAQTDADADTGAEVQAGAEAHGGADNGDTPLFTKTLCGDNPPSAWVGRQPKPGEDSWQVHAVFSGDDSLQSTEHAAFLHAVDYASNTDDCSLVVALGMTLKADGCLVGQSEDRNGIPSESKKLGRGVYWKCQRHNAKGRGAHCPTQVRVIEHKYRNEAQVQFKGKCNHEAAVSTAKKWSHEQWQQFQASAAQGHNAKELQARMQGAGLPEMEGADLKRKARESLARLKVLCACLNVIIYELHMFVYCRKKQHPMR